MADAKNVSNRDVLGLEAQAQMLKKERRANNAWNKLKRNKTAMIGLIIVILMVFIAVFAPFLAPYDPNEVHPLEAFIKPFSEGHILGTDQFGRDLLSRIIYGARISLIVAVGGTMVAGVIGVLLGLIAGFMGGIVDSVIMRIMDGFLAFPFVLLSIILMTVLGEGLMNVIIAIGVANIPSFARVVRGEVHIIKNEEYCNACRVIGVSTVRLLFTHILPNAISPIIVYATLNVASAIISEAALSFLGLGIPAPTASWGSILREGKNSLRTAPFVATFSGAFILVTVLGFNLFGDGIRDVLDPKMKQ